MTHRKLQLAAIGLTMALGLLLSACGSSSEESGGGTIRVPEDQPTIQAAVNAAKEGDLILVSPGVYKEAVSVETNDITIRGLDRNQVILEGNFELTNGIKVVEANGVTVENMTARHYTGNGFYWTGVDGYRGAYLTSYRTGDYGLYAFNSVNGIFENSYASGSRDAGFYIGECYFCNAVMDNVVSEWNGLGYSGTNAGGNLTIVNSIFRYNRAGIVPNSGSYEKCYPQRDNVIVGNTVYGNQNPDTPAIDVALLAMGNGILVAGGVGNTVERNLVFDHERTGIGLVPFPEEDASDVVPPEDQLTVPCDPTAQPTINPADVPSLVLWSPRKNRVIGNKVSNSGLGDIAVGDLVDNPSDLAKLGNCFADNEFTKSAPANLETLAPCDGTGSGDWATGSLDLVTLIAADRPPEADWRTTPEPPAQPNMPDAATAPAPPARAPRTIDVAAIKLPTAPPAS